MPGQPMVSFADWLKATNEQVVTPPTEILSEASKRTYLFGEMLDSVGVEKTFQTGSKITETVQDTAGTSFGFYNPNEVFTPAIEDLNSKMEAQWRFARSNYSWTDQELILNGSNGSGGGDRLTMFKNLKKSKEQACVIETYNGMENALWATPVNATMEATTGNRPYSIPTFITEDGLAPAGFTNVEGKNPSTVTQWRNQVNTYDASLTQDQLVPAFDDMWLKLNFQAPTTKEAYFKETKFKKFRICTDRQGVRIYLGLTREANDRLVPQTDLGYAQGNCVYNGVPVKYIEALDDKGWTTGQPRYFWINFEFLFPVMHSQRYMYTHDPMNGGIGQPFSWVVYKDSWYNIFCRSRRRQGIIAPG